MVYMRYTLVQIHKMLGVPTGYFDNPPQTATEVLLAEKKRRKALDDEDVRHFLRLLGVRGFSVEDDLKTMRRFFRDVDSGRGWSITLHDLSQITMHRRGDDPESSACHVQLIYNKLRPEYDEDPFGEMRNQELL